MTSSPPDSPSNPSAIKLFTGGAAYDQFFENDLQISFEEWCNSYLHIYFKIVFCTLSQKYNYFQVIHIFNTSAFFLDLRFDDKEKSQFELNTFKFVPRIFVPDINDIIQPFTNIYMQLIFYKDDKFATFVVTVEVLGYEMRRQLIQCSVDFTHKIEILGG